MAIEIIGYGKGNGELVHAIRKGEKLLCDTRRTMNKETSSAIDVTCKKCLRYPDLHDLIKKEKQVPIVDDKPDKKKEKAKEKTKTKTAPDKKETAKAEVISPTIREEVFSPLIRGDSLNIKHTPTGTVMFNNVPVEIINVALAFLNTIPIEWESGTPPKEFIPLCREAYKEAFEEVGFPMPKTFSVFNAITTKEKGKPGRKKKEVPDPKRKEKKEKRTLKRRGKKLTKKRELKRRDGEKKEKRTLKRRKESKKLYGIFNKGQVPYTVAKMVQIGATMHEISKVIIEDHGVQEAKAQKKILNIVLKKMVKKAKVTVQVVIKPEDGDWHFKSVY